MNTTELASEPSPEDFITNPILRAVLYDNYVRYGIYGGLYLILFMAVGIASCIKTCKSEKNKIIKRKKAFMRKPGSVRSKGAAVELTDEQLKKIREIRAKAKEQQLKSGKTPRTLLQKKSIELAIQNGQPQQNDQNGHNGHDVHNVHNGYNEMKEEEEEQKYPTNNNQSTQPKLDITIDQYDPNENNLDSRKTTMEDKTKYRLNSLDSPTFESQKIPSQSDPVPPDPLSPTTNLSSSNSGTTQQINLAMGEFEEEKGVELPRKRSFKPVPTKSKLDIPANNEYETSITVETSISRGNEDDTNDASNNSGESSNPPTGQNEMIEDDDDDDYHSKYSYYDDDEDLAPTLVEDKEDGKKKKKKCLCNDQCYILWRTDFFKDWPKEMWRLKSVYGTLIVYFSDYITDLNVLVIWGIEGYNQYYNGYVPPSGLNMVLMSLLCAGVLMAHKIISTITIARAGKMKLHFLDGRTRYSVIRWPWLAGILQFFDVYIFAAVYDAHIVGYRTDRLKLMSNLESVLEASPQVLLQLVYLMQSSGGTGVNTANPVVILGLLFSVMKLGSTAITNDGIHVVKEANKVMDHRFWIRAFYRVFELAGREFLYVLMWLVIGEKFLILALCIELVHNIFLYLGGCLSKSVWAIFAHLVQLAQLSYTIVEGDPIHFFRRGYRMDDDQPHKDESRLQFAYSTFMADFNKYKEQRSIEKQRQKYNQRSKRNELPSPTNNVTPVLGQDGKPTTSFTELTSKFSGSTKVRPASPVSPRRPSDDTAANGFPPDSPDEKTDLKLDLETTSISQHDSNGSKWRFGKGSTKNIKGDMVPELTKVEENEQSKKSDALRDEITKFRKSTGDLDGLYSYIAWVQMLMVWYLNVYLATQTPQLIMLYQRTALSLFWLFIIGMHGGLRGDFAYWRSESGQYIAFKGSIPILIMYGLAIVCTIMTIIFFWLLIEMDIVNTVKKREEIKFKSIYDAIWHGRLDAIINQFDKPKHLTTHARDGKSPLYYAAELKQTDIAAWLIGKKCVDINDGANQNRTPLYIAARVGAYDIVKLLLDQPGCKYNEPNSLGRTPLYAASREGRYDIVVELLKQPLIDVNHLTKHSSCALAAACQHGHLDIVKELLKKPEIEINQLNESNYTPIFIAALGTHSEIVKVLLEREEIEIDKGAKNDETLFYVSCERGMDEIVQILIDRPDYDVDINKPNSKNYTPLYIAACFGHEKIIEILMGIDKSTLNQCDNIGRTPFFVACRKGNTNAVFKLLEYDDIDIHKKDQDELTPFAAACQGGSVEVVERLMKLVDRSEIIGVDRMRRTPFFMACREGQTAVVERLMREDNIIDINQPDKLARTPLMVCVKRAHNECVRTLCLNMNIDINQPDHQGRSPLFVAARAGPSHGDCVKSLMSRNDLFINAKAQDGKTALHIACQEGHSSIVMQLLDHPDIDVNEPDEGGTSPLAIANKNLDNNVYMRMVMISMRD